MGKRKWLADLIDENNSVFLRNNVVVAKTGSGKTMLPGALVEKRMLEGRTLLVTIDNFEKDYVLEEYGEETHLSIMTYEELSEAVSAGEVNLNYFQNVFYDEASMFLDERMNSLNEVIFKDNKCKSFFLTQSLSQFSKKALERHVDIEGFNVIDYESLVRQENY